MKKVLILSIAVLAMFNFSCEKKDMIDVKEDRIESTDISGYSADFTVEKVYEIDKSNTSILARINKDGELIYTRSEKAYVALIRAEARKINGLEAASPNDIEVLNFAISNGPEDKPNHLFAQIKVNGVRFSLANLLEVAQSGGLGGKVNFIKTVITHSCTGCSSCEFIKNGGGNITGCECPSSVGFSCVHTKTQTEEI